MNTNEPLSPDEIERLLESRGPARPGLDEALRRLRSEFSQAPSKDVRTKHLAAMAAAVGQAPASVAPVRRARRRHVGRRIALGCAASLLVSGSALAATGSLPRPAQDAVAKVAHDVGLNLPHSTQVTNPRAVQNSGVQFANAKKQWLECEKSGAKDCGPKPTAQQFVHPSTSPESPEATDHHGNGNGPGHDQGHGQGQSTEPGHTPHPTGDGNGHATPKPSDDGHGSFSGSDGGSGDHGGSDHTPEPTQTPGN